MKYISPESFAMTGPAKHPRAPGGGGPGSSPGQEIPDGAAEGRRLLHVGNVPRALELPQGRAADRLLDLPDAGEGRLLGADDQQHAPIDAGEPGPQIIVRQG